MIPKFISAAEREFSAEDVSELAVLLSNKSMGRALKQILISAEERDKLSVHELGGQEGLASALKAQGIVQGLRSAVEQLISLAEVEEDDTTS